jgi:mercuric ion transport protein
MIETSRGSSLKPAGALAGLSVLAGGSAAFATSCCVVPLSLAALGATGAVSGLTETLAPYNGYLLGVSAAALGGGWLSFFRWNRAACAADGSCSAPGTRRWGAIGLGVASLVVLVAFAREQLEPVLVGSFFG